MSFSDPAGHVWTTGEQVTAANLKTYTSDNIDALNKRLNNTATVATSETRANAAYGALTTAGPIVGPITTGVFALVILTARIANNTISGIGAMSFAVSGATTLASADTKSNFFVAGVANQAERSSVVVPIALTAGANTFTSQYRSNGADTATFLDRELTVIPQF